MVRSYIVKIEKLVLGGQGLGRTTSGQVIFVWGALPDETVEVTIIKKKKNYLEGVVKKIITPSENRVAPLEDHYLVCSPWQIISPKTETDWKLKMATENYERLARIHYPELKIVSDTDNFYHYRNKIEYSFALNEKNELSFGFSERGGWDKVAITGCTLASPAIAEVAKNLLLWLRQTTLSINTLKSLILRSNSHGEVAAALFINQKIDFTNTPKLDSHLRGFQIYFTDHRCPASRPDELLFSAGQNYLTEKVNDIELKFGLLSFFQINPPLFDKALHDIEPWLDNHPSVVDYFSGVGAISLALHKKIRTAKLIEINREAIDYAKENIQLNKLNNFSTVLSPSEKAVEYITPKETIIFDPPRAGLGLAIIRKLQEIQPPRIIYLSCDPATHARDIMSLSPLYEVKFLKLYNFFPRTPHIESLAVLELKK